jgi:diguanylate cyclase (GGDEF)-like protein
MTDDISQEPMNESEVSQALIAAVEHMPIAVGLFHINGRVIYTNRIFKELHDFNEKILNLSCFVEYMREGLLSGWTTDPQEYLAKVKANLEATGEHRAQLEVNGRILDVHDVLIDNHLIISTQKDMTQQILDERRIAYLASHDMLTGLANRLSFEAQLAQTIITHTESGKKFSVLMADLDHFKPVNDTYGHAAGDAVLKEVAHRFRGRLGHNDFAARLGGDEFVFLCRDEEATASALALRLGLAGGQPILFDGLRLSVGISVGYAVFPDHGLFAGQLLRAADVALYQAKKIGHGAIRRYHHPDQAA